MLPININFIQWGRSFHDVKTYVIIWVRWGQGEFAKKKRIIMSTCTANTSLQLDVWLGWLNIIKQVTRSSIQLDQLVICINFLFSSLTGNNLDMTAMAQYKPIQQTPCSGKRFSLCCCCYHLLIGNRNNEESRCLQFWVVGPSLL